MKIFLRPVTELDGELIVRWRNSDVVSKHCLNKKKITLESNENFFNEHIKTGKYIQYIVERVDDDYGVVAYPIATIYLKDIDYINRRCELCIFTSDDEEWNTESQSIAVQMLIKKAFEEIGIHKIYSYVFYKFIDEAELLKNAGFVPEAILKNEAVDENGKFEDIVRFCIVNE